MEIKHEPPNAPPLVITGYTLACKCGTANDTDAIFCKKCGKQMPTEWICECKTVNDPDAIFCKKCGKKETKLKEADEIKEVIISDTAGCIENIDENTLFVNGNSFRLTENILQVQGDSVRIVVYSTSKQTHPCRRCFKPVVLGDFKLCETCRRRQRELREERKQKKLCLYSRCVKPVSVGGYCLSHAAEQAWKNSKISAKRYGYAPVNMPLLEFIEWYTEQLTVKGCADCHSSFEIGDRTYKLPMLNYSHETGVPRYLLCANCRWTRKRK